MFLAGCGGSPELLVNGDFEDDEAWFWFENSKDWVGPFTHTEDGRSGRGLRTHLVSADDHGSTAILGAIQEVTAQRAQGLPARLSGSYFVDTWSSDAERTYIQAVISFFPEEGAQRWCPGVQPIHPCQIAFLLGGLDQRPFSISNRVFVLPPDASVVQGRWVDFSYDVQSLMAQAWGVERLDYRHLWLYLEARYETQGPRDVELDVRWDDVSLRR